MWMRTILDNSDKRKKRKRKVKIKMRELKNGGKEKKIQGKTGLGLGNLGIYNFLLSSNFPSCHFLFWYSLIEIYIYIYI